MRACCWELVGSLLVLQGMFSLTFGAIADPVHVPEPSYYFPLNNQKKDTSLTPENPGIKVLASVPDLEENYGSFGTVFRCSEQENAYLRIPKLSYGTQGEFAVAFWMLIDPGNGTGEDYLLSQGSSSGPSYVAMFMPEQKDGDHGVLRAVVKDGNDKEGVLNVLDSTGCVNNPDCSKGLAPPKVNDGVWHHVTLTTLPNGKKGYALYVDGELMGTVDESETQDPSGGDAMFVSDEDMYLCARAPGVDVMNGSIAGLAIWDTSLTDEEIHAHVNFEASKNFLGAPGMCATSRILNTMIPDSCAPGYDCYVVPMNMLEQEYSRYAGRIGTCIPKDVTDLLPDQMSYLPETAFFPLTSIQIQSMPYALYRGISSGASLVEDNVFGHAIFCDGRDNEYVALEPVPYGITGRVTVNFWFLARPRSDGQEFSWLFSDGDVTGDSLAELNEQFGINQIQIFLRHTPDGKKGIVGAYLRDFNDQNGDAELILNSGMCASSMPSIVSVMNFNMHEINSD